MDTIATYSNIQRLYHKTHPVRCAASMVHGTDQHTQPSKAVAGLSGFLGRISSRTVELWKNMCLRYAAKPRAPSRVLVPVESRWQYFFPCSRMIFLRSCLQYGDRELFDTKKIVKFFSQANPPAKGFPSTAV